MFLERHLARLARDATALGMTPPESDELRAAFTRVARESRAPDAIARVALIPTDRGRARIEASLRELTKVARERGWSAIRADVLHPGPRAASQAKTCARETWDAALAAARAAGADEALLFDAAGRLVEGARSNFCYVTGDGELATPPLARGAVAGIARAIALERVPELSERDLARSELGSLRELVALNAVRGAVAITQIDGRAVATGAPGELARRLARELDTAAEEECTWAKP